MLITVTKLNTYQDLHESVEKLSLTVDPFSALEI